MTDQNTDALVRRPTLSSMHAFGGPEIPHEKCTDLNTRRTRIFQVFGWFCSLFLFSSTTAFSLQVVVVAVLAAGTAGGIVLASKILIVSGFATRRVVPVQAGGETPRKEPAASVVLRRVRDRRCLGGRRLHPPRGGRGGGRVREPTRLRSPGWPCVHGGQLLLNIEDRDRFLLLSAWYRGNLTETRLHREREELGVIFGERLSESVTYVRS